MTDEKITKPVLERNKGGRPPEKVRPEVRLTTAYVSKLGAECGDMFRVVDNAASAVLSVDGIAARELARVAERLAQMQRMFQ